MSGYETAANSSPVPCAVCHKDYIHLITPSAQEECKENFIACSCGLLVPAPYNKVDTLEQLREYLGDALTQHQQ